MKLHSSRGNTLRSLTAIAFSAAVASLFPSPATAQSQAQDEEHVKNRVVVLARSGASHAALERVFAPHGGKSRRIGNTDLYVVDLPGQGAERSVKNALQNHPLLRYAELDRRFKLALAVNDPYAGAAWHLTKIGAPAAWDRTLGAGVTIAVLDTGVDGTHPDLAGRMVTGWNFADNNSDARDIHGHGTAVAGAAAATVNNGMGVASVSGGARIMPLRVTDPTGYASGSSIASAIVWAADHGARVANVSIDGLAGNSVVISAAQYMKSKGGLVVVAAGNSGSNSNQPAQTSMIPVSATDSNDLLTSWSSFGNHVAVAAPGLNIWSTMRGGSYGQWWGTSFSSPVTAGVVALMMSARPDLPNTQIESLLYASALDLGTAGRDIQYGHGRVDAMAAVAAVTGAAASDATAPTVAILTPAVGTTVTSAVGVDVSALDNVGVARVELRVDGNAVATDTASPFQFSWDSTKVANGTHTLEAVAVDAAGNAKVSAGVSVMVNNPIAVDTQPPTVTLVRPLAGSRVNGTVTVSLSASDNAGAAGIRSWIYIDGTLRASGSGASLSYNWNTKKVAAGTHTIQAVAQDSAGNRTSTSVQVTR